MISTVRFPPSLLGIHSHFVFLQERPLGQRKTPPANKLHNVTSRLMSNTTSTRIYMFTEYRSITQWLNDLDVDLLMSNLLVPLELEPVLKDHPIGHKNVICQYRWSWVTGSAMLKCRSLLTFGQKCVIFQDSWSLMAVVSRDRFHCSIWHYW